MVGGGRRWKEKSRRDVLRMVLAEAALQARDYKEANSHVRAVLQRWPHSVYAWNTFCRCAPNPLPFGTTASVRGRNMWLCLALALPKCDSSVCLLASWFSRNKGRAMQQQRQRD